MKTERQNLLAAAAETSAQETDRLHSAPIMLTPEESVKFIKALNAQPAPPTQRLARALKLYRETVVER